MMVVKSIKTRSDDLNFWNTRKSFNNNNELDNIDDEDRSLAFSVNLLLKNKHFSQPNLVQLPAHLVTSEICQCHRSFHLFCTDLFPKSDHDIDMIHIHPAPRISERDSSRRISTPYKKYHRHQEDNDQDPIGTPRSEPVQMTISESQLLEKKLRITPKIPPRTTSLNIPATYHSFQRNIQNSIKYSPSILRVPKQTSISTSNAQLHIRALSVFDQSSSTSQIFIPRGPPPSPKTPTQESSMILINSITPTPLRAVSIVPRVRNSNENEKKPTNISSVKITNYQDHAREYLSASDCSDDDKNVNANDDDDDDDDDHDKNLTKILTISQPKLPIRNQSISRSGTALRDRLLSHNASRYLSLAQVYYSSLDIYKNLPDKTRRHLRSQTRLIPPSNENDDAATAITKTTTTTKTAPTPAPQSKSVFGFSKTASSMHFGHAAGRLGLHGSFEKWPRPLSRRTPIERKQEVTTLRLVTLPLVTS